MIVGYLPRDIHYDCLTWRNELQARSPDEVLTHNRNIFHVNINNTEYSHLCVKKQHIVKCHERMVSPKIDNLYSVFHHYFHRPFLHSAFTTETHVR